MTSSQVRTIAGIVVAVCAALVERLDILPASMAWAGEWVTFVAVAGGIVLTAWNQSLHTGHVSIPVETARAKGVAPEQTEGK